MKHRWHDEIVAWAGGAEIEAKEKIFGEWLSINDVPNWNEERLEFRACKEALAETQEATEQAPCEQPVAWQALCVGNHYAYATAKLDLTGYHSDFWQRPLYTTPPSHEWVGLSDRELFNLSQQCNLNHILGLIDYGRAIEAKLREKNG